MKYKNSIVFVMTFVFMYIPATLAGDKWEVLFDGSDLTHWRNYQQDKVNDGWVIKDGALTLIKKDAGDIITREQYTNFELTYEWRIAAAGNSGVFYRVIERNDLAKVYFSGLEMQILDNKGRAEPPLEQAGGLFAIYAPKVDNTKPVGEFNSARLIVKGNKVEHWLNGQNILSYDLTSDDFKTRVQKSKFATWPAFNTSKTGHIALQDHGDEVAFKNIKIKRLSE